MTYSVAKTDLDKTKQYESSSPEKEEPQDSTNKKCATESLKQINSMRQNAPSQTQSLQNGRRATQTHISQFSEGMDAYKSATQAVHAKMDALSQQFCVEQNKRVSKTLINWSQGNPSEVNNSIRETCSVLYRFEKGDPKIKSCKDALVEIETKIEVDPNQTVTQFEICKTYDHLPGSENCSPFGIFRAKIPLPVAQYALRKQVFQGHLIAYPDLDRYFKKPEKAPEEMRFETAKELAEHMGKDSDYNHLTSGQRFTLADRYVERWISEENLRETSRWAKAVLDNKDPKYQLLSLRERELLVSLSLKGYINSEASSEEALKMIYKVFPNVISENKVK